ncbi:hypothetical protein F0265_23140 [Vibrio sp. RE88]|nr:hypothetical protein [Vibrio sp. RE88]
MDGDYIRNHFFISLRLSTFNNKDQYSFINKSPNSFACLNDLDIKKATSWSLWLKPDYSMMPRARKIAVLKSSS